MYKKNTAMRKKMDCGRDAITKVAYNKEYTQRIKMTEKIQDVKMKTIKKKTNQQNIKTFL
jgi:hypothetical protein